MNDNLSFSRERYEMVNSLIFNAMTVYYITSPQKRRRRQELKTQVKKPVPLVVKDSGEYAAMVRSAQHLASKINDLGEVDSRSMVVDGREKMAA